MWVYAGWTHEVKGNICLLYESAPIQQVKQSSGSKTTSTIDPDIYMKDTTYPCMYKTKTTATIDDKIVVKPSSRSKPTTTIDPDNYLMDPSYSYSNKTKITDTIDHEVIKALRSKPTTTIDPDNYLRDPSYPYSNKTKIMDTIDHKVIKTLPRSSSTTIEITPIMTPQQIEQLIKPNKRTNHIYASCEQITGQIYTNRTGKMLITSASGNNYCLILYDFDSNLIWAIPIPSRTKTSNPESNAIRFQTPQLKRTSTPITAPR